MKTVGLSLGLATFITSTALTLLPTRHDSCGQGPQAGVWAKRQEIGAPGGWKMR